jgi:thymidylate kinase
MIISFLGTDGSGKSTIIEKIRPLITTSSPIGITYEHLRPNYFSPLARIFNKEDKQFGPITDPHNKVTSRFIVSLVRWAYYMLDYTFGFYIKIYPNRVDRLWIFDRYYYDYFIDQKRMRIKLPKWILKFGEKFIPEPEIIFCLGTDPKIIHTRKPELPLVEVERQVLALKMFCKDTKRAVWIDTGSSVEESTLQVLSILNHAISKRLDKANI